MTRHHKKWVRRSNKKFCK